MSISAMLVAGPVPSTALPKANLAVGSGGWGAGTGMAGLAVECSSRPQKKATAHHRKTRPKKTQPWDVRRKGPTSYPPLPALPPEWTLVSSHEEEEEKPQQEGEVAEVVTSPA